MRELESQATNEGTSSEPATNEAGQPSAAALASQGDAAVDRMLAEEGGDDGGPGDGASTGDPSLDKYRRVLGRLLGPALYELVVDAVSPEELAKHTKSALDGLTAQLNTKMSKLLTDEGATAQQAAAFANALKGKLDGLAKELIKSPAFKAVVDKISDVASDEPWVVLASMLLASAAAVMMDVPVEASAPVKIGKDVKVTGKADFGSIRHLQYQGVGLAISYTKQLGTVGAAKSPAQLSAEAHASHTPQAADTTAPDEGILRYGGKLEFRNLGAIESFFAEYKHDFANGVEADIFRSRMNMEIAALRTKLGSGVEMTNGEVTSVSANVATTLRKDFSLSATTAWNPSVGSLTQTAGVKMPSLDASLSYAFDTGAWLVTVKIPLGR